MKRILVTGAAGFIGYHLCQSLVADGHDVVGVDSLEASYGRELPVERWRLLADAAGSGIFLIQGDLRSDESWLEAQVRGPFDSIVHLAAWPGVRSGETHPVECVSHNIGTLAKLIEWHETLGRPQILFASSSSVYGDAAISGSTNESISVTGQQKSLYASCKFISEQLLKEYCSRSQTSVLALRFFTVIGPLGRPDMAYASFARQIELGEPVSVFGDLSSSRDYTSVFDLVEIVGRLMRISCSPGFSVINAGFGGSYPLGDLIAGVQVALGASDPRLTYMDRPKEDALATQADPQELRSRIGLWDPMSLQTMLDRALADKSWIWLLD